MSPLRNALVVVTVTAFILEPLAGLQPARAQCPVNPDSIALWLSVDGGEPWMAGEIYREGSDPEKYVEHWVLYPSYLYPSSDNGVSVTLVPGHRRYEGASDFLSRVPFERGARYVKVDCLDTAKHPLADPPDPDKPGHFERTRAQIPVSPDSVAVWLEIDGRERVLAGEIYREGDDPSSYVEHWVLFPNYVYPSPDNGAIVTLEPGHQHYDGIKDFLASVPFAEGSRYVKADCLDSTVLPGR